MKLYTSNVLTSARKCVSLDEGGVGVLNFHLVRLERVRCESARFIRNAT